ncbi:MAG: DUF3793 family protein [Firmicutes bacterium]|nr:DUF3793 family protein [Bacillota bacterium]MBR3211810.1 DUF3793 family protein [Bacillota bacterium]MCR4668931.1 DUF3793 family protein [Clostridia bacterium]
MTDELIVKHCSPTLAGIKTGNLFSVSFDSDRDMVEEIRGINRILTPRGLRAIPFRKSGSHFLLYVFRPDKLAEDLSEPRALNILREKGYRIRSVSGCVAQLADRICGTGGFPHEIGLFLGYPPEDVKGFIDSTSCGCGASRGAKLTGYWKVYGDVQKAADCFARFDRCTKAYRAALSRGRSLEQLIVRS